MLQEIMDKMRSENKVSLLVFYDHELTQTSCVLQKQVIHCLVVVSRLSSGIADKRDVGCELNFFHMWFVIKATFIVHYEKLFKACQAKYQGEGPTGVLLVYPQHCVHLMEAPWEIVVDIVADLKTMDTSG